MDVILESPLTFLAVRRDLIQFILTAKLSELTSRHFIVTRINGISKLKTTCT